MAKTQTEKKEIAVDFKNDIKTLVENLNKIGNPYKATVMADIDDTVTSYYDTGIYALNYQLTHNIYRGFPAGRIVTIVGNSMSGKTAVALQLASMSEWDIIYYIQTNGEDAEKDFVNKFENINQEKFVRQTIDNYGQLKRALEQVLEWNTANPTRKMIIIVDSIAGINPEEEDTSGFSGGRKAATFKSILRSYANQLRDIGSSLILIAQYYMNPQAQPHTDPRVIGGGVAVVQYSHLILEISASASDSTIIKGTVLGAMNQAIVIKNKKSRYGTHYAELNYILDMQEGFTKLSGLYELCFDLGMLVKKDKGNSLYMPTIITKKPYDGVINPMLDIDDERDAGFFRSKFYTILQERPEVLDKILNYIDTSFGMSKKIPQNIIDKIFIRTKTKKDED